MSTVQLSIGKFCVFACGKKYRDRDQKAVNELFHHCFCCNRLNFFFSLCSRSPDALFGELPSQRYSFRKERRIASWRPFFSLFFWHSCIFFALKLHHFDVLNFQEFNFDTDRTLVQTRMIHVCTYWRFVLVLKRVSKSSKRGFSKSFETFFNRKREQKLKTKSTVFGNQS